MPSPTWLSAGRMSFSVRTVPTVNWTGWTNCRNLISEQKQVIYLSVDTDRKGRELCRELSRRLGVDRCRIVTYGEAYKDAQRTARGGRPGRTTEGTGGRTHSPAWKVRLRQKTYGSGCTNCLKRGYTSGVELGIPNLDRNHEAGNGAGAHRHRYSRTWQIGLCR